MKRKGIILAGGSGTRLYPLTQVVSKQLLPVYNKPMIYYPLSTLMLANVREILIISTLYDLPLFRKLLGNGSQFGLKIEYAVQASPEGIAQALIIGEEFLNGSPSVLILGDNIFYGNELQEKLGVANMRGSGATLFAFSVDDPERYGVVEFSRDGKVTSLEEKPAVPKSRYAVTGLYFYDEHASRYAKQIKPSNRGEFEITDLNNVYLEQEQLSVELMGRGYSWFDAGTHESLLEAHQFVRAIEHRQGLMLCCPEEIALYKHWIDIAVFKSFVESKPKNEYGQYLMEVIERFESASN